MLAVSGIGAVLFKGYRMPYQGPHAKVNDMKWRSPHGGRRTIDADRIVDMVVLNGWAFEWRAGQRTLAIRQARAALDGLLALGLPHDGPRTAPLFDPAEIPHFVRWAGLYRNDPTYDRYIGTGRGLVWEPHAPGGDRTGPPCLADLPVQHHTLTVWRTSTLAPGNKRLRLPTPLDGAAVLLDPGSVVRRCTPSPARLDLVATVPEGPLRLGVQMHATDAPGLDNLPGDLDLALRAHEGLIHGGPRIDALATELAGTSIGIDAIRKFWDFVFRTLSLSAVSAGWLDPVTPLHTVLDAGWCDCRSATALFVALCRARAIPARIITGYTLHRTAPSFHTWAEAWIGGAWRPFDLLDLSYRGRDPAWMTLYFGQLRQRLPIERLPHIFTGLGAISMPGTWHMLTRMTEAGTEVQFRTIETDALIYADAIELGHHP